MPGIGDVAAFRNSSVELLLSKVSEEGNIFCSRALFVRPDMWLPALIPQNTLDLTGNSNKEAKDDKSAR